MSLLLIETALVLFGLGVLIGLCRRANLREVTRLLGAALTPFGGHSRSNRDH
jgi:hypothetical protein